MGWTRVRANISASTYCRSRCVLDALSVSGPNGRSLSPPIGESKNSQQSIQGSAQGQKYEASLKSKVKEDSIQMAELAELSTSKTQWRGGRLLHIHIAPAASNKMQELAEANFVAGRGIEGDRYFLGIGTYSAKPDFREVTVFEMEVLEALARNDPPIQSGPIKVEATDHRRNLTVRGVPLNHLVGRFHGSNHMPTKIGSLRCSCGMQVNQ
jgi:hypothetical protein